MSNFNLTKMHQKSPFRTGDFTEPFGTNGVVAKPLAVKFYVPPDLMKDAEAIFERQGVKLSEGLTRLIRHMVDAPDEIKLVVLGQAHGDAAIALAESVMRRRSTNDVRSYPIRKAAKRPPKPPADE